MQALVKRGWVGIDVSKCGKPGNTQIVNSKYQIVEKSVAEQQEDSKSDLLFEMAIKIRELDELKEMRLANRNLTEHQQLINKVKMEPASTKSLFPHTKNSKPYSFYNINKSAGTTIHRQDSVVAANPYQEFTIDEAPGLGEIKYS